MNTAICAFAASALVAWSAPVQKEPKPLTKREARRVIGVSVPQDLLWNAPTGYSVVPERRGRLNTRVDCDCPSYSSGKDWGVAQGRWSYDQGFLRLSYPEPALACADRCEGEGRSPALKSVEVRVDRIGKDILLRSPRGTYVCRRPRKSVCRPAVTVLLRDGGASPEAKKSIVSSLRQHRRTRDPKGLEIVAFDGGRADKASAVSKLFYRDDDSQERRLSRQVALVRKVFGKTIGRPALQQWSDGVLVHDYVLVLGQKPSYPLWAFQNDQFESLTTRRLFYSSPRFASDLSQLIQSVPRREFESLPPDSKVVLVEDQTSVGDAKRERRLVAILENQEVLVINGYTDFTIDPDDFDPTSVNLEKGLWVWDKRSHKLSVAINERKLCGYQGTIPTCGSFTPHKRVFTVFQNPHILEDGYRDVVWTLGRGMRSQAPMTGLIDLSGASMGELRVYVSREDDREWTAAHWLNLALQSNEERIQSIASMAWFIGEAKGLPSEPGLYANSAAHDVARRLAAILGQEQTEYARVRPLETDRAIDIFVRTRD